MFTGLVEAVGEVVSIERDQNGAVLELGGGYCHFINNIRAAEKHVVDLYPGVTEHAAHGVVAHVQSCSDLSNFT